MGSVSQVLVCCPVVRAVRTAFVLTLLFFCGETVMANHARLSPDNHIDLPLPLDAAHWRAIFAALRLSPQQARIVELMLRGAVNRQIAEALGLREPTVRTYLERIFSRLGVRNRMELAMRVLAVSHEVIVDERCPQNGRQPKR